MTQPSPRAAPPRTAARAEQVRAIRQRVLAAARELFLRRGYAGTTVEAIAQHARVSPQTVYNPAPRVDAGPLPAVAGSDHGGPLVGPG